MRNQLLKRAKARGKASSAGYRAGRTSQRHRAFVGLEPLEQRALLSTYNWVSGSGYWNDPSNWIDNEGQRGVPLPGDDAIISEAGITVIVKDTSIGNLYSNADIEVTGDVVIEGDAEIYGALHLDKNSGLAVPGPGGSLTASGATTVDDGAALEVDYNGTASLPGLTSVAGSTDGTSETDFLAFYGGSLDLPALTQATGALNFWAYGAGSELSLPSLSTVGGSDTGAWTQFWAWGGGEIDLGAAGLHAQGAVDFSASGSGSVLNLPGLATIAGSTDGTGSLSFGARDGGEIDLGALTQATGDLSFTADGSGSELSLTNLSSIAGSDDGTWTTQFNARDGGEIDLGALTQATGDLSFTADGSVLNLPSLATIAGSTDGTWFTSFAAQDGGEIDLGAAGLQAQGWVSFEASGSGSILNLPSLATIAGSTDGTGSLSFYAQGSASRGQTEFQVNLKLGLTPR
jgi:hypothetical protein